MLNGHVWYGAEQGRGCIFLPAELNNPLKGENGYAKILMGLLGIFENT